MGEPVYKGRFSSVYKCRPVAPYELKALKVSPENTHEIMFTAADPNVDYDPDPDRPLSWTRFVGKVAQQFVATDEEAELIGLGCAKAVTDGILPAIDVGDHGRRRWATMIKNTLQHLQTGGHGEAN